ncbi:MAG: hypothetical protein NT009_07595 [Proteobacteria bacterium]|nr:hypothetical protein [Pseudomonadota bacterium]
MKSPRTIFCLSIFLLAFGAVGCGQKPGPDPKNFPPPNPYLADSPWPMAHANPYIQASSPFPGPTGREEIGVGFLAAEFPSVILVYSGPYPDGRRMLWGSNLLEVFKADPGGPEMRYVDRLPKAHVSGDPIVGAYILIDLDGTLFVPTEAGLDAYGDLVPGDPESKIVPRGSFTLSPAEHRGPVVGINLTYDGWVAFATAGGTVGVVARDFSAYRLLQLGPDDEVSNSIAVDEQGGIYVVTSRKMYRVQWTGTELSLDPATGAWTALYEAGGDPAAGRLGKGSGSTPTVMGTGEMDKIIVITDGQELMHLVLFWKDEIPPDWSPLAPGKDPRIAAEVPVTFGDPGATSSVSEQSVLVYGYGAVVVNNDYGTDEAGMGAVLSGAAAFGVEKFAWDPSTRKLESIWANPGIPCPNGIPTMSASTNLVYCIGKRGADWTLEGIDWDTGESVFSRVTGSTNAYNSVYAAAEIGPDGTVVSGTLQGLVKLK